MWTAVWVLLAALAFTFAQASPRIATKFHRKRVGVSCDPIYQECYTGTDDTAACCIGSALDTNPNATPEQIGDGCYNARAANRAKCDNANSAIPTAPDLATCRTYYALSTGTTQQQAWDYYMTCHRPSQQKIDQYFDYWGNQGE